MTRQQALSLYPNLRDAKLSGANLRGADLRAVDLSGAKLSVADLRGANLSEANLSGAKLSGAKLSGASLRGANLRGANLSGANLSEANLSDANLRGANLRGANLSEANLSDANLRGADLRGADLRGALGLAQQIIVIEGVLIGYKKTSAGIVTLRIPAKARRVNAYGSRKCRAEYAVVIETPPNAVSDYDDTICYIKGRRVKPDSFDADPRVECSHGIYFFITRAEAEAY